ncbi:TPA: hypothetical protein MM158_004823 [Klebsiella pneumoniae]|nr:hypothetical protein [Klebsiella pneumoniae]
MGNKKENIGIKILFAFMLSMVPALAFAEDAEKVYEMIRLARTVVYVIDGLVCTVIISYTAIMWKFDRKDVGDFVKILTITLVSGAAVALVNWAWSAYATSSLGI